MGIYGQDWSSYQGARPYAKGLSFGFVKATEGTGYVSGVQSSQAAQLRAVGAVVGFYHFLHPGNIIAQAHFFVNNCDSKPGDLLACDWESTSSGHASSAEKDLFIKTVKQLRPGHRVLLYCNTSDWLTRDTSGYAGDGLWAANYNGVPGSVPIRAPWLIHQYSSTPVDKNYATFASTAAMKAWAQGAVAPKPPVPAKPPAPPKPVYPAVTTETVHYTVVPKVAFKAAGDITLVRVGLAVRDAKGNHLDFAGAVDNVHLKAGQVWYLDLQGKVFTPGKYTVFGVYKTPDGVWHECTKLTLEV